MNTRGTWIFGGLIGAFLIALVICVCFVSKDQEGGFWLPSSASTYSAEVDYLWKVIFVVVTGMFLLTEGCLVAFCILYRRRPGHRPAYTHGNKQAELIWTVVPALMLLGLALWQIPTWDHIKKDGFPQPGDGVTQVRVLGEQFKWNIMYSGTKRLSSEAKADFSLLGSLHVPFGDKVLCHLRTKDVIHSFFIPHMRVKQDTVPGLRQRAWFQPNRYKLIDLRKPAKIDGSKMDGSPREVQEFEWVNLDIPKDPKALPENPDKEFMISNGKYFKKRIALSSYSEKEGLYQPIRKDSKIRTLYQGRIEEGKAWSDCDYAVGIFEIACAELCGEGHYTMRGFLIVEPRAAYDAWLKGEMEDYESPLPVWKYWRD